MAPALERIYETFKCEESLTRCQEIIDEHKELFISHVGISHEKHHAEIPHPGFQAQASQVHLQQQSISEICLGEEGLIRRDPHPLLGRGILSCVLSWEIKENGNGWWGRTQLSLTLRNIWLVPRPRSS